jgi:hypothetical protein
MHGSQELNTSTLIWALFSVGAARCYTGKTRPEVNHYETTSEESVFTGLRTVTMMKI